MELIYADKYHQDIGILQDYNFDLAYGTSENNFEFSMPLNAHCCEEGYFIYIEGTEYGGIIDSIKVDTSKDTVYYMGRTWHGILANAIIQPDKNFDYLTVSGDANAIIGDLIERLGLSNLFYAKETESNFEIVGYQFYRYVDLFNGLLMMLSANNAKLKITHKTNKVMLEAVELIDYSADEEWESTQVDIKLERAFHPCNHLICLGSGNLAQRKVIHLFTDENGGIQPYARVDNPVEDSDYILTEENKLIEGIDEVCKVYDYANAQTAENYVLLTSQPKRWSKVFGKYFVQVLDDDGEVRYIEAEATESETYNKLTTQPSNWAKKYMEYFVLRNGYYENVSAVTVPDVMAYKELTKEPKDWAKKYKNYYVYWSDGVKEEYRSVSGVTSYYYKLQTMKPSDWETNYKAYFVSKKNGGYENIPQSSTAPKWKKSKYYTRKSSQKAPDFKKTRKNGARYYIYYVKTPSLQKAPTFVANKYYQYVEETIIPAWTPDSYFRKTEDAFADLVENGIKKLEEYWNADKIDVSLGGSSFIYDIGDIVGATELTTGLNVIRAISKKIVTISSGDVQVKYKLGG